MFQIQANSQMKEYLEDRMGMRRERRDQRASGQLPPSSGQRYENRAPNPPNGNNSSYPRDGQRRNNFHDDRGQNGNRVTHKPWARENSPTQSRRPNIRYNSHDRVHVINNEDESGREASSITILRRPTGDSKPAVSDEGPVAEASSTSSEEKSEGER